MTSVPPDLPGAKSFAVPRQLDVASNIRIQATLLAQLMIRLRRP